MPYKDPERQRQQHRQYYASHRQERSAYYFKHSEMVKARVARRAAARREELRAYNKAYRKKHSEQRKAKDAAYYQSHRDKKLADNAQYRATHQAQIRVNSNAWRAANPEAVALHTQRRQSLKRSLPATLTRAEWEAIKVAYKGQCAYCGTTPVKLTQDHVIPLSKGGGYTRENIVPACPPCNSSKQANLPTKPIKLVLL